jgi:hypothetical protein
MALFSFLLASPFSPLSLSLPLSLSSPSFSSLSLPLPLLPLSLSLSPSSSLSLSLSFFLPSPSPPPLSFLPLSLSLPSPSLLSLFNYLFKTQTWCSLILLVELPTNSGQQRSTCQSFRCWTLQTSLTLGCLWLFVPCWNSETLHPNSRDFQKWTRYLRAP